MSKKQETRKCKQCGTEHNIQDIKRRFGTESSVYLGGYCSAQCYTNQTVKQPTEEELAIQKLAEALIGRHGYGGSAMDESYKELTKMLGPYPVKPAKPVWKDSFTSRDAEAFGKAMAQWEADTETYKADMTKYHAGSNRNDQILRKACEIMAGFENVPQQYRAKVWSIAWEDGHSNGWYEVYQQLYKLVTIFTNN